MEFRAPKVKKFYWKADHACQYPASLEKVSQCVGNNIIGKYNGSNVVIDDPHFILPVYNLGCYGKGSLSRGQPNYLMRKSELDNMYPKREESESKEDAGDILQNNSNGPSVNQKCTSGKDGNTTVTSMTKSCEENTSCPLEEEFILEETLQLNLEEAYFLSYCLGCLNIVDLFDKGLSLLETWKLFCESQDDFVQKYVVYHHYRSKGWVVKPGLKFGGDFVLYKYGSHITHASYIVIIEVIRESGNISEEHQQAITWGRFISLNRMAESAGKEVILCRVVWPNDVLFNDVQSPEDLKKFSIVEVLTRRWISSQEKELIDKEEMG